jgi:probable HAF family extracellular repeat protein
MLQSVKVSLLVLSLVFTSGAVWAVSYTFVDLGAVDDTNIRAWGINSSNAVVGQVANSGWTGFRAFVWSNGTRMNLPNLDGTGIMNIGYAINDSGLVTGVSSSATPSGNQAFVIKSDGSDQVNIGTKFSTTPTSSRGNGINASGQVAGSVSLSGLSKGFFWDGIRANATILDGFPEASGGMACGLNDLGRVVGYSSVSSGGTWRAAYLWEQNVGYTDLNTTIKNALVPRGSCSSRALAINSSGQIIGDYNVGIEPQGWGYLYNSSAAVIDLGDLGGTTTCALAINDSGSVVGYSGLPDGTQHAFLWTPTAPNATTGSMVDLNDLIANPWDLPSGYYLNSATSISDSASIAGTMHSDTGFRAFVLIVPEPGTFVLFVGAAGLLAYAWRKHWVV